METWQIAVFGMTGAAVPEVMRVVASLRSGKWPTGKDWLASTFLVLLGLGALMLAAQGDTALKVAVLGASFPQLFSGLVASTTAKKPEESFRGRGRRRNVADYIAWRLTV